MRFLHTADWHVGKPLRGRARVEEHAKALEQVARIAVERQVDAVLVAGDVFDSDYTLQLLVGGVLGAPAAAVAAPGVP